MLISIIIPVYNVEQFLRECLDSVLAQTMTDFEVLLVDDGSPDRAGEICDEYAARDARIRVFHTPNQGVCAARNLALDHAKGKYVYFIDSDDWIHPERLRQLLAGGMSEDGICFGAGTEVFADRRVDQPTPDLRAEGGFEACAPVIAELMRRDCFGWVWGKLFSKKIIDEHRIRFSKDQLPLDDEIFTAEYCRHISRISTDSRPYYYYRYVPGTLSRKVPTPLAQCQRMMRNLQRYLDAGYDGEILYVETKRTYSQLRRLLRRHVGDCADWNSETCREVVAALRKTWGIYRQAFRWRYVRSMKELRYALLGRLTLGPDSDGWLKLFIHHLHI